MKAIVYESKAGHTKKYAEILGEKINLPVYSLKESMTSLSSGDEIIFMGWIMAGNVNGYDKAAKRFKICALCPVGMAGKESSDKTEKDISAKYSYAPEKIFYLEGGFDINKHSGIYKFMMKSMIKMLDKKSDKTSEEAEMTAKMKNNQDCVNEDNLIKTIDWYEKL